MNTDKKGCATEGIILAELLKRGLTVLTPFGYSQRYDLVIDVSNTLYRLQCKTGRLRRGAIQFNTCSMNNVTREKRDYRGQIDFFAVLEPQTMVVYLVEPDRVGRYGGYLRLFYHRFTDRAKTIAADSCTLDTVLKKLEFGTRPN